MWDGGSLRGGCRGVGLWPVRRVVKKIEAAAKAKRIFVGFIQGLALGFLPKGVGVRWNIGARSGWGGVAEKRVWFHLV